MLNFITSSKAGQILANWTRRVSQTQSIGGRYARGAFWSLSGALVSQGANLLISIITARCLGAVAYGRYGMILTTVSMLGVFAGIGLGVTSTRFVAEFRTRDPAKAGKIIVLGSALSLVSGALLGITLFLFAMPLARTLNAIDLTPVLRISSVLLFMNAVNGAQTGALVGIEAFREIARIKIVRGVFAFPLSVFAVLNGGLQGIVWALTASSALACALSHHALRRRCLTDGLTSTLWAARSELPVLWKFALPAFLSGALAGPATWAASAILVNQPGGYPAMAVFTAGNQWRNVIAFMPALLVQVSLPMLSNLNGRDNSERYRSAFHMNLAFTLAAGTVLAIPIVLAAPQLMSLYGRGLEKEWAVLALAAASAVVACLCGINSMAILSSESVWVNLGFTGAWAASLVFGSRYFIERSLHLGLSIATLISYLTLALIQFTYLMTRNKSLLFTAKRQRTSDDYIRIEANHESV